MDLNTYLNDLLIGEKENKVDNSYSGIQLQDYVGIEDGSDEALSTLINGDYSSLSSGVSTVGNAILGGGLTDLTRDSENLKTMKENQKVVNWADENNRFNEEYDSKFNSSARNVPVMEQGGRIGQNSPLREYNVGGTHMQNPNGGIPVDENGNPASQSRQPMAAYVEQGENSMDDYVFSNKIVNPMTSKTFAKDAKAIKNKYTLRENEDMSDTSMRTELIALMKQQEDVSGQSESENEQKVPALPIETLQPQQQPIPQGQPQMPSGAPQGQMQQQPPQMPQGPPMMSTGGTIDKYGYMGTENYPTTGGEFSYTPDMTFGERDDRLASSEFNPTGTGQYANFDYQNASDAWNTNKNYNEPQMKALQQEMYDLGYYNNVGYDKGKSMESIVDGRPGARTAAAYANYSKSMGTPQEVVPRQIGGVDNNYSMPVEGAGPVNTSAPASDPNYAFDENGRPIMAKPRQGGGQTANTTGVYPTATPPNPVNPVQGTQQIWDQPVQPPNPVNQAPSTQKIWGDYGSSQRPEDDVYTLPNQYKAPENKIAQSQRMTLDPVTITGQRNSDEGVYEGNFDTDYRKEARKDNRLGLGAGLASSAYQFLTADPNKYMYDRVHSDQVDYTRERTAAKREGAASSAMSKNYIANNASSGGNAMSNIIASQVATGDKTSQQVGQSFEKEQNQNVGIINADRRMNTQISNAEQDANIGEINMSRDIRNQAVQNAANYTQQYVKDSNALANEKEAMSMMGTENYKFERVPGSKDRVRVNYNEAAGYKYSQDSDGKRVYWDMSGKPLDPKEIDKLNEEHYARKNQ